jgi:sulfur carrier protein
MRIELNGEAVELVAGASVAHAVDALGANSARGVAAAVDGEVVPRSEWAATALSEGQQVEVLHAVQGG